MYHSLVHTAKEVGADGQEALWRTSRVSKQGLLEVLEMVDFGEPRPVKIVSRRGEPLNKYEELMWQRAKSNLRRKRAVKVLELLGISRQFAYRHVRDTTERFGGDLDPLYEQQRQAL